MKRAAVLLTILCLVSLTACSPLAKQIVKTEYIKQQTPAPPAEPVYYPVAWIAGDGRYCLDAETAKNLLKNVEIMKAYQNEMRQTLLDLRGAK